MPESLVIREYNIVHIRGQLNVLGRGGGHVPLALFYKLPLIWIEMFESLLQLRDALDRNPLHGNSRFPAEESDVPENISQAFLKLASLVRRQVEAARRRCLG